MKSFSETAEENKTLVLPVILPYLKGAKNALEIASGTGQQIVYFAEQTPEITWQPSDLSENIRAIMAWVESANLDNILQPKVLDVANPEWSVDKIDFVYTSNSLHIMSWWHVKSLFEHLGKLMAAGCYFCVYGPFCFSGVHVSDSNLRFDQFLKQRDPQSGVRDLDALKLLAKEQGIVLNNSVEMPHNNHILVWQKQG